MSNIIIGMGLLPLLIFANYIIINLCKIFPKYILAISGVMIGLDAIITLGYTFTLKQFVTDIKPMVLCIGLSILIAMVQKVLTMLRTFKVMFANEIGN